MRRQGVGGFDPRRVLPPCSCSWQVLLVELVVAVVRIPPFVLAEPRRRSPRSSSQYCAAVLAGDARHRLNALVGLVIGGRHRRAARRARLVRSKAIDGMLAPVVAAVAVVPIVALAPVLYTMFGSHVRGRHASSSPSIAVVRAGVPQHAARIPAGAPVHRDLCARTRRTRARRPRTITLPVRPCRSFLHRPAHRLVARGDLGARRRVLRRPSRGPRLGHHDRGRVERLRPGVGVRGHRRDPLTLGLDRRASSPTLLERMRVPAPSDPHLHRRHLCRQRYKAP